MTDGAVAQRIADLERGAQLLRDNPDRITHDALIALVADWIDAEALMWDTSQRLVDLMNATTAVVSGGRAGKVHFGDVDGKPQIVIDTSTHADRIIAAVTEQCRSFGCGSPLGHSGDHDDGSLREQLDRQNAKNGGAS